MTMHTHAAEDLQTAPSGRALWAGVLGAPAIWGIQLEAGYALAPWLCRSNHYILIHLITIVAACLALSAAYLSWLQWRGAGAGPPDDKRGGPMARRRFVGVLGILSGILYTMLIVAQGISSFFFDACWT